ncbi:MAG: sigma-54-dependent Fis family transcriptional regulator [Myxococcales bacterium]|nr:sigma-54-dependent Fis family transcriptional regulator [Myxococcales bacterium]
MSRILIVDDERSAREYLRVLLDQEGYANATAANGVQAIVELEAGGFDLVVTDLHMPEMGGADLLAHVRQRWPSLPVIVLTAASDIAEIVDLVRQGATNYLVKPAAPNTVLTAIERALATRRAPPAEDEKLQDIVGASKAIVEVRHRVMLAARSDVPVLITGETGTGKELVARAIHRCSGLAAGPFVAHNCAVSPRDLFESQFFGHKKGAFTGADSDHSGLLRDAHGGVLFLDELETLDPMFQAKLLRVLDDGEVRPVGSSRTHRVSVRFIAATNRDARAMIEDGELREDLYYRLRGFEIRLPRLRDRAQDVPLLVRHFLPAGAPEPTDEALDALQQAPWPGNVRELMNVVRSASAVAGGDALALEHLPPGYEPGASVEDDRDVDGADGGALRIAEGLSLKEIERRAILHALDQCDGNRSRAARLLQIDRSTLRRKLQEFGIEGK